MERRAFITAVPVAAIALPALSGEILDTVPTDPHRVWLDEWKRLSATMDDIEDQWRRKEIDDGTCEDLFDPLSTARMHLIDRIAKTPARTPEGMLAQVEAFQLDYAGDQWADLATPHGALIDNLKISLRAMAV